jgi:nitrate/nitrite transporter NarK
LSARPSTTAALPSTTEARPPTKAVPPARAARLHTRAARPAVRGWLLAVTVYFLAVLHRSSLGVAGLLAEQRFGITAGQLGVFVVLQLGVYAAMQIPTGVLVDRYGPRRLLVVASALMGAGQLLFALAPSYPIALVARALLGCGDAMTFISVLRFAAGHFSARRYPFLVALTATIGTVGNVAATLPLELLLEHAGWSASFTIVAVLSLVAAVAVWALLDDTTAPPKRMRDRHELRSGITTVTRRVARAWALPGTRLGFWVHFACMSAATSFGVLWGHPYLVDGVGFTSSSASAILMFGVLAAGVAGPLVGVLIGRRAHLRVALAEACCAVSVAGWAVTALLLGDHPPRAYIVALFVFTMIGAPVSMIAFALARDYNGARMIGTASGVVNVGGFVATVVVALGFGWTLSALGGMSAHDLRFALLVPVAVQAFGATRVVVWHRRLLVGPSRRQSTPPAEITSRYQRAESLSIRSRVEKSTRTIPNRFEYPNAHSKLSMNDHTK